MAETDEKPNKRRKPQTIDLAPSDVREEKAAAQAHEPMPEPAGSEAFAADEPKMSESEAPTSGMSGEDKPSSPRIEPEPASNAGWIGGALAGAVAGALIAFLATQLTATTDLGPLQQRLSKLEATAPQAIDLVPLQDQLKTVDGRVVPLESAINALRDGLAQQQGAASAATEAAGKANASVSLAVEELNALRARVDELATQGAGVAADKDTLASLAIRLTAAETLLKSANGNAVDPSALSALQAEVSGLKTAVDRTQAQSDQALKAAEETTATTTALVSTQPSLKSAARLAVHALMRSKIDAGEPFAAELAALQPLVSPSEALSTLSTVAETGVPSRAEIAGRFAREAAALSVAMQPKPADDGILNQLAESAASLIEVKPVEGAAGSLGSVADTIDKAIRSGRFAEAITALKALPGDAATLSGPLISLIEQRAAVEAAVIALPSQFGQ
jgi:hypothetical protein